MSHIIQEQKAGIAASTTEVRRPVVSQIVDSSIASNRASARIAFVTNFCPHYRVRTFEKLAAQFDMDFFFYSDGSEWYWQKKHGTRAGQFRYSRLPGFTLLGTRITATLPAKLWRGNYDAIIKCVDGRFALATTFVTARLRKKPFVLWTGIWSAIDTPFHRLFSSVTRYIYRRADAIVVYGEHVRRYLLGLGIAEEKIFVAPHAMDNEEYSRCATAAEISELREKLRLAVTNRMILYLGRLEEIKGLTYLLEAFRCVAAQDAVLVIAGEGSEQASLQKLSAKLGIESRVRFAGYVPIESTLPYYAAAHALVLPSVSTRQGKELWGLVVNEAMNQGVPVIATDAVGAAAGGLVRNGVNGLVVPERDAVALANAIQVILDSPGLREEMSGNARRTIAEWTNERMVQGFREAVDYAMHKDDRTVTSL